MNHSLILFLSISLKLFWESLLQLYQAFHAKTYWCKMFPKSWAMYFLSCHEKPDRVGLPTYESSLVAAESPQSFRHQKTLKFVLSGTLIRQQKLVELRDKL